MRQREMMTACGAALLAAALTFPVAGAAQAADSPWLPWTGCWVPAESHDGDVPMTCIRPTREGAEFLTVGPEGAIERRLLVADGIERSIRGAECPGVETASFSRDGARVYLRAEHACAGGPERRSTGLIAMLGHDRWLHARSMDAGGRTAGWVEVYMPATRARARAAGMGELMDYADGRRSAIAAARAFAAAPIAVDDILEAHARTDAEVVRAWLAEQEHRLDLDARGLRRLAAAGVPDEVIDVAVAIAYPERFALARQPVDERAYRGPAYRGHRPVYWDPFWSPWYGYGAGYGHYGYGYGWGVGIYDPFGYRWHRPRVIVIDGRDPAPRGRAVPGRGYTRGSGSTSQPAGGGGGREVQAPRSPTSATPTPSARGETGRSATPSRPAASSGEGRSSGTSTGRTARPRGGNDTDEQ